MSNSRYNAWGVVNDSNPPPPASPATEPRVNEAVLAATAPLCKKHQPDGGTRASCLICALMEDNAAFAQIDYALGSPNEYECSLYDVDCNKQRVVERVKALVAAAQKVCDVCSGGVVDDLRAILEKTT